MDGKCFLFSAIINFEMTLFVTWVQLKCVCAHLSIVMLLKINTGNGRTQKWEKKANNRQKIWRILWHIGGKKEKCLFLLYVGRCKGKTDICLFFSSFFSMNLSLTRILTNSPARVNIREGPFHMIGTFIFASFLSKQYVSLEDFLKVWMTRSINTLGTLQGLLI